MQYDVNRAKYALQFVVKSPYHSQLWRKVEAAAKKPRAMPFKDDQEPLNELVHIGRQSKAALDNLRVIIDRKRKGKNDYQRQYMEAKRRRDRKFIKLQELILGHAMTTDERRRALVEQYEHWHQGRDELLARLSEVSWDERNARLRDYWADIERDLDEALTEFS